MSDISKPTSMVISREMFEYVQKVLEVVFDILARKEQDELDIKALEALNILKTELAKVTRCKSEVPFLTWLSTKEFSVLKNEFKPGKHLYDEYSDKFQIATYDQDIKQDSVIFQGTVDCPETMFRIGRWVGFMHQMNINAFGENYKIDINWDSPANN